MQAALCSQQSAVSSQPITCPGRHVLLLAAAAAAAAAWAQVLQGTPNCLAAGMLNWFPADFHWQIHVVSARRGKSQPSSCHHVTIPSTAACCDAVVNCPTLSHWQDLFPAPRPPGWIFPHQLGQRCCPRLLPVNSSSFAAHLCCCCCCHCCCWRHQLRVPPGPPGGPSRPQPPPGGQPPDCGVPACRGRPQPTVSCVTV